MPVGKRYTFLVESNGGVFRHATEDWDFDAITREVNGSMTATVRTDQLVKDLANGITDLMNDVTIRAATPQTGAGGLDYFRGYVAKRALNLRAADETVGLECFGHASRLFETIYRSGTTIVLDHTGVNAKTASNIAKDIIDKVRALDSAYRVNYTTTSVQDSVDSVQDKFQLAKAGDALNRCVFLAFDSGVIWHWLVLGDNVFRFKKAAGGADHVFTFGHDVEELPELSQDLLNAANEIFVVHNGSAAVKRVADAASITSHGNRSLVVRESGVPDATTATEIGNAYLEAHKPPILNARVTVVDTYDKGIESINPGDTCRILNLPADVANLLTNNMFITRTTYRKDRVDLELSLKHPMVQSAIEKIRQRFEESRSEGIPTTHS